MWFIFFILVLVAIYLVPTVLERRRTQMDHAARSSAPGKTVRLSQGVTHYQWIGPTRGPIAVLIHGLSTNSEVWKEIAEGIAETGYRVLVYDLYGRGYSDSVSGAHDVQLYMRQLDDLLTDQKITQDVTLVGYSMGAAIATEFAATEPHRMHRLVLLAPSGIDVNESDFSTFCRTKPIIGDWVHGVMAKRRMLNAINEDADAAAAPHVKAAQLADLDRQGFFPAILASRRGVVSDVQKEQHQSIMRDAIPTIVIWGEDDTVVPVSALGKLAQWNRSALHEVIKGAGHALPYSHAKDVIDVLRKMLRGE